MPRSVNPGSVIRFCVLLSPRMSFQRSSFLQLALHVGRLLLLNLLSFGSFHRILCLFAVLSSAAVSGRDSRFAPLLAASFPQKGPQKWSLKRETECFTAPVRVRPPSAATLVRRVSSLTATLVSPF